MTGSRKTLIATAAAGVLLAAGCVSDFPPPEYIAGGTGDEDRLGTVASVDVLSPTTNLNITGGTPVEVSWTVVATTKLSNVDIIFDPDRDPNNRNEIFARRGLSISESTALLDTSDLLAGAYNVGVLLNENNELSTFDYAAGALLVNQQSQLFFSSPRNNFTFDRSIGINPQFTVAWQLADPDSTVSVEIFIDPDSTPNGNEIKLRDSTSQTGDSFVFDLPTASFQPGTYRILALVSDGLEQTAFYAPGAIRLLSRLAGILDLRGLDEGDTILSGAVFEGLNPRDNLGSFVSTIRDVDRDGFSDFIMLAQFAKPNYQSNLSGTGVGEAYMVHGRAERFTGRVQVNSTGKLFRGNIYGGPAESFDPIRPSRGITSFTTLSDWDGDTIRDMAFGCPFTDSISVAPLDPQGYFRTGGVIIAASSSLRPDQGFPGGSILHLSHFGTLPHVQNADSDCPEGVIGPKSVAFGTGQFHWHLADIAPTPNDGSIRLGARIGTNIFDDNCGESISAYDPDALLIAIPNRDPAIGTYGNQLSISGAGTISLYFSGRSGGNWLWAATQAPPANANFDYPGTAEPAELANLPHRGPYHYTIDDSRALPDFFGAPASPGYLLDPDDQPNPTCILTFSGSTTVPTNTVRFWTNVPGARLSNVKGVDDMNRDGYPEILIGAPFANDGAGKCFIILGRQRELVEGGELQLEELSLPMNAIPGQAPRIYSGVQIVGSPGSRIGTSQDAAGDFNNDGYPDAIIGSPLINNRRGGAAIFFGADDTINLTETEIQYDKIADLGLGVIFAGDQEDDLAGARVAGVGDIDGDGNDDVLIAAPGKSVKADVDQDGQFEIDRKNCGVVYLIYGSPNLKGVINLSDIGTQKLPGAMFVGASSADALGAGIGYQGDQSFGIGTAGDVDGDGRRDLLLGSVAASPKNRVNAGVVYLLYGTGD